MDTLKSSILKPLNSNNGYEFVVMSTNDGKQEFNNVVYNKEIGSSLSTRVAFSSLNK